MISEFLEEHNISTLVDLLRHRAGTQPDKTAYIFLVDGESEEVRLTYGELDAQAKAIAAKLQTEFAPGERALLLYPPGLEFISAFFGCLYAGVIAVPCYPPDPNKLDVSMAKLKVIIADCTPEVILTTKELLDLAAFIFSDYPDLEKMNWMATNQLDFSLGEVWKMSKISESTLAFLQYTSGSTGDPKGVMVSHGNLLSNGEMIRHRMENTKETVIVGWLPIYHDMGLIGNILHVPQLGIHCVLMSPTAFLQKPMRWLKAISKYKATISSAPNFAYDLCVKKFSPEECENIDLSRWRSALDGAEPVRAETMKRFTNIFSAYGFRPESFFPAYGMAEATLMISGPDVEDFPKTIYVDANSLSCNRIVETDERSENRVSVTSCGKACVGEKILIVDQETFRQCSDNQVGEIWVSGQNVAQGYWNKPELTKETFNAYLTNTGEGPFLRTGDLGFMKDDELFVTGRLKDLIIIRGRNHYPQDIELTVEQSHESLRPGCGAVFSVEVENEERLVVVQEIKSKSLDALDTDNVIESIRKAVTERHELQYYAVVLIEAGAIPKTSSGKIQRRLCKILFLENKLKIMFESRLETSGGEGEAQAKNQTLVLRKIASSTEPAVRISLLELYLQEKIAMVAGISPLKIDVGKSVGHFGLDSVKAMELKAEIEEDLKLELDLSELVSGATIIEMAGELDRKLGGRKEESSPLTIRNVSEQSEYSLSYGQQGLYFESLLSPASAAYNIGLALKIKSEIDFEALKSSLLYLLERHPQLRVNFVDKEEGTLQRINPVSEDFFNRIKASGLDEEELKSRVQEYHNRPFDLKKGPLCRFSLFSVSENYHVLLFGFHHIVFDGWSLWNFLKEFKTVYSSESQNKPLELPLLKHSYADYIKWQREFLFGEREKKLEDYWTKRLEGELPVLDMPLDYQRPARRSFNGASHTFLLSSDLTAKIKRLAAEEKTTPYVLLLAAYQILLHRYTGQKKILISCPVAGRSRKEFFNISGYFINMMVLTADFSEDIDFRDFLSVVRQDFLEALRHQDYPFVSLVKKLSIKTDPSRSPLTQTHFVLQSSRDFKELTELVSGETINLGGLEAEFFELDQQEGLDDLGLEIIEVTDKFLVKFKYNIGLFYPETIERMAGHFQTLLEGIVFNPGQKISELPLLMEAEKHKILVEWNDTKTDYPKDKCIHQLFEEQAAKTPDSIAVVFEDESLTYAELNARGNQLARYLRKLGVEPETLVGICIERSLEMVIGLLGILKAGGAYVPLDPSYPKERLAYMLSDSAPYVLITQSKLLSVLPEHQAKTVCLDADWEIISKESSENAASEVKPDNLAYVIYTSGSTGKPKGAMIRHISVMNLFFALNEAIYKNSKLLQRIAVNGSLSFDTSVKQIIQIIAGRALYIIPEKTRFDAEKLMSFLRRNQINVFDCVPLQLQTLIDFGLLERRWTNLTILAGGDAISGSMRGKLGESKEIKVYNLYGPTEYTVDASVTLIDNAFDSQNIGRPISNTQVYILDANLNHVPIGVSGELHIGGAGLARGYLNRPKLTAKKFISNPFSDTPGSRLYKTGDLARWLPDGNIEFIGRMDHQVKIRGFRIELGEIEAVLNKHGDVKEAVVIAREDQSGDKRLTAYIHPNEKREPSSSDLRAFLQSKLPDYMIPSFFVFMDALPLTPNGKIDRKALPAPDMDSIREKEFAVPRNETEETLVKIWAEVLGIDKEKISVFDNFFEVGGHSLLAVGLMSKIQTQTGKQFSVAKVFEFPTIQQLSELLGQNKETLPFSPLIKLRSGKNKQPVFLMHPGDGQVFCYTNLIQQFDNKQPFYGLQAYGIEPGSMPLDNIEDMAGKYLRTMKIAQPEGPYLIVGFCGGGGALAYEASRQLKDQGEEVGLTAILDAIAPRFFFPLDEFETFVGFIRDFGALNGNNLLAFYCKARRLDINKKSTSDILDDSRTLSIEKRLKTLQEAACEAGILSSDMDIEYLERIYQVYRKIGSALVNYDPEPYEGNLVFFRAAHVLETHLEDDSTWQIWIQSMMADERAKKLLPEVLQNRTLGWDRYSNNVVAHDVPGNHFTMLRPPHIRVLAKKLKRYLE